MRTTRYALLLGLMTFSCQPHAALASACNREKTVTIHFEPGKTCWTYDGNATTFVGDFTRNQALDVHMEGEAADFDPKTNRTKTYWRVRTPDASGPNDFFVSGEMDSGQLSFRAPASGTYRFGFSPCAMWGGNGSVRICAR
ncbi:MAG: hypothetical protein ACLQIQ_22220 [Beijerinckiaceae bacterium]